MRPVASAVSVASVLLGLGLATKAISLAVGRVGSGFSAIMNGLDSHVSTTRFVCGVLLLVLGFLTWLVVTALAYAEQHMARNGDRCPSCKGGTHRVKRTKTQKIFERLLGRELSARHGEECEWSGLALKY